LVNPVLKITSMAGAPISFSFSGLNDKNTSLTLKLEELNGPTGRLRPGAIGSIVIYSQAVTSLGFILVK